MKKSRRNAARSLFLLLFFLWMPVAGCHAAELSEVRTELTDGYRIDLMDEAGNLAFSDDKGYASLVRIGDTEHYYDEHGQPVAVKNGYYGRRIERLETQEDGSYRQLITYLDTQDQPVLNGYGYAMTLQTIAGGHCVQELYYDTAGKPIALYLDHYGYSRVFNEAGQVVSITYLGADGTPAPTNRRYTTVKREYDENGNVSVEWYFDEAGNPTTSTHGEYGLKKEYDQERKVTRQAYLRLDGTEFFVPTVFLAQHMGLCALVALALSVAAFLLPRKLRWVLLAGYTLFILYMTLLTRETGNGTVSLELFRSYRRILSSLDTAVQIYENIILFIPFAAILYAIHPTHRVILLSVLLSMVIEGAQWIWGMGWCEVDDVISNGLGGAVGCLAGWSMMKVHKPKQQGSQSKKESDSG